MPGESAEKLINYEAAFGQSFDYNNIQDFILGDKLSYEILESVYEVEEDLTRNTICNRTGSSDSITNDLNALDGRTGIEFFNRL